MSLKLLKRDDLLVSLFEERYRKQLVSIWKEAFSDSEEYINRFFDSCCAETYVYCENDTAVGMVSVLDVFCCNKKGAYIYALAVDKKHRGKGIASKLLDAVQQDLIEKRYDFSLVVPSPYDCLEKFYKKRGFDKELCLGVTEIQREGKKFDFAFRKATAHEYQKTRYLKENTVFHSDTFYNYAYDDMLSDGAEILEIQVDGDNAFCICYNRGEYVIIKEMLCKKQADTIAQVVMKIFDVSKAVCISFDGTVKYPYALMRRFNSSLSCDIYANLLLDGFENRF